MLKSQEISLLVGFKILTGNVGGHHEICGGVLRKAAEWRRTDQWKEGRLPRSRGPSLNEGPKQQRTAGGGRTNEDFDKEVTDLIAQVHLNTKLESGMRDMESATYCTLFLPKERDIVKETNQARQEEDHTSGSPTQW